MANVSVSTSDTIDQIYEAAFVPERWPKVLDELASNSGAATGQIIVFDDLRPMEFQATGIIRESLTTFRSDGHWKNNQRIQHFHRNPLTGFVTAEAYFSQSFLDGDRPLSGELCQAWPSCSGWDDNPLADGRVGRLRLRTLGAQW